MSRYQTEQHVLNEHYARLRNRWPQKLDDVSHKRLMDWVCGFRAHLAGEAAHRGEGVTAAVTGQSPRL